MESSGKGGLFWAVEALEILPQGRVDPSVSIFLEALSERGGKGRLTSSSKRRCLERNRGLIIAVIAYEHSTGRSEQIANQCHEMLS